MREQVYKDPRPPEHFARFHERARTRDPDMVYGITRAIATAWGVTAFRALAVDVAQVPAQGPLILAANHFSYMDHFFIGMFLRRKVRFMAKSQLFKPPMQFVYSHGGVFPVRRGFQDEEAFITAHSVLARGGCVVMYPEGGRSRTGEIAERPRPGIGRLALESGAPVLPVAIHGSQRVRNWKRLQFPRVTVRFGQALRFDAVAAPPRERQQEVADEVMSAIRALYATLDDPAVRASAGRGVVASLRASGRP